MVPQELRDLSQWLVWRFEKKAGQEKPGKIPYYIAGKRRQGQQGSEEDRLQLVTFDAAMDAMSRGHYDGVGFAFLPGDGLIGIDLDKVVDDAGEIQERAQKIIAACASYTEYSPSKRGFHIFVRGHVDRSFKSNQIGVEVFCGAQFFTFTGEHLTLTPQTVNAVPDAVLRRLQLTVEAAKEQDRAARAPTVPPNGAAGSVSHLTNDFARVNQLAMSNLDVWVPSLFPNAKRSGRGWRVASRDLGRDLQEDLSITPDGIVDWGVNDTGDPREGRRTPIDLVLEWGGVSFPKDALHWLAQRQGIDLRPMRNSRAPAAAPDASVPRDFFREEDDWENLLVRGKGDRVLNTLPNVYNILRYHEDWKGLIALDEFAGCITKLRVPPFGGGSTTGEWSDVDDGRLSLWLAQQYMIEPHDRVLEKAVMNVAQLNRFHPVRAYLLGLKWDGAPRLVYWLQSYLGAEPVAPPPGDGKWTDMKPEETYLGKVGSKFLIGAVARVMRPGCKMDNVLILEGLQGIGKSSAFGVLAGEWFTDQQIKIGEKDTYEVMRGNWVVELAELDALSKSDATAAKAFFSRAKDRFRAFYGRRAATIDRQQVFGGTVNHGQYLRDSSGNRRYWPVRCASTEIDLKELAAERDQIWAEAVHRFEAGDPWWVERVERPLFEAEQEARYIGDAWEMRIRSWLDEPSLDQLKRRDWVTTDQILAEGLKLDLSKWTPSEQIRVGFIMDRIGWPRKKVQEKGDRGYRYMRPQAEA